MADQYCVGFFRYFLLASIHDDVNNLRHNTCLYVKSLNTIIHRNFRTLDTLEKFSYVVKENRICHPNHLLCLSFLCHVHIVWEYYSIEQTIRFVDRWNSGESHCSTFPWQLKAFLSDWCNDVVSNRSVGFLP